MGFAYCRLLDRLSRRRTASPRQIESIMANDKHGRPRPRLVVLNILAYGSLEIVAAALSACDLRVAPGGLGTGWAVPGGDR